MDTRPLVSIVMPTYNMATFLLESIPSILEQDYSNYELIIVDDGSTDQTKDVIATFLDNRILYVYKDHDYMASMNAGINMAQGKYILRMDADDIMMKGRIKLQIEFMEIHPDIDICGGGIRNFGCATGDMFPIKEHYSIIASLLLQNTLAHPTIIMRKDSINTYIQQHGSLYDKEYIYAEDYKLWTCLAMEGYRFANVPEIVVKHRISEQAVTVAFAEQSSQTTDKVKKQYLKYAIEQIISKDESFSGIINEIMTLSGQRLLAMQDILLLVYVLYKKILK